MLSDKLAAGGDKYGRMNTYQHNFKQENTTAQVAQNTRATHPCRLPADGVALLVRTSMARGSCCGKPRTRAQLVRFQPTEVLVCGLPGFGLDRWVFAVFGRLQIPGTSHTGDSDPCLLFFPSFSKGVDYFRCTCTRCHLFLYFFLVLLLRFCFYFFLRYFC